MGLASFHRSLAFSAVAGLAALPAMWLLAPIAGGAAAATLYLTATFAIYALAICPEKGDRPTLAVWLGLAGIVGVALRPPLPALAALLSLGLALLRSGHLYALRPARGLAIEAGLLVASLGLARAVGLDSFAHVHAFAHGSGVTPTQMAGIVWAIFLVQSTYFLFGGRQVRVKQTTPGDPFDAAVARANELLGRD